MDSKIKNDILALEDRIIKIVFSKKALKTLSFQRYPSARSFQKEKDCGSLSSSRVLRFFIRILTLSSFFCGSLKREKKTFAKLCSPPRA